MPTEQKDAPVAAEPADQLVGGDDLVSAGDTAAEATASAPARPKRTRQRKPQPTFDDGATTRVFKFPSRTYPRSAYYVTNDEIIVRIKKARQKWQLTFPKKRIVSYRTNRWFHKPRWVEIELTYLQALRHGLIAPTAAPAGTEAAAPEQPAVDAGEQSVVSSVVEAGMSAVEADAEKRQGDAAQLAADEPPALAESGNSESPTASKPTTNAASTEPKTGNDEPVPTIATSQAGTQLPPASLTTLLTQVAHKVEALTAASSVSAIPPAERSDAPPAPETTKAETIKTETTKAGAATEPDQPKPNPATPAAGQPSERPSSEAVSADPAEPRKPDAIPAALFEATAALAQAPGAAVSEASAKLSAAGEQAVAEVKAALSGAAATAIAPLAREIAGVAGSVAEAAESSDATIALPGRGATKNPAPETTILVPRKADVPGGSVPPPDDASDATVALPGRGTSKVSTPETTILVPRQPTATATASAAAEEADATVALPARGTKNAEPAESTILMPRKDRATTTPSTPEAANADSTVALPGQGSPTQPPDATVPLAAATAAAAAIPILRKVEAAEAVAAALQPIATPAIATAERERPGAFYGSKAQRRVMSEPDPQPETPQPVAPSEIRAVWLWAPVVAMLLITAGVVRSQWVDDDDFEMSIVRSPQTRMVSSERTAGETPIVTSGIDPATAARPAAAGPEGRPPAPEPTAAPTAVAPASAPKAPPAPVVTKPASTPPVAAPPSPAQAPAPTPTTEPAREPVQSAAQKRAAEREAAAAAAAERKRLEAEVARKKAADAEAQRQAAEAQRQAAEAAKRRAEEEAAKHRAAAAETAKRQKQADADAASARRAAELATQASREPIPIPGAVPIRSSGAAPQSCRETVASAAGTVSIQFEFASSSLRQSSIDALHRLAASLSACPSVRLRIEGHTDSDGDLNRNQALSERRATAVLQTLAAAGTSPAQLAAVGLGQSRPLVPNDTADNKRKNRRIELVVN